MNSQLLEQPAGVLSCLAAAFYDMITVGGFIAFAQKFKHGGLKRIMRQIRNPTIDITSGKSRLDRVSIWCNVNGRKFELHGSLTGASFELRCNAVFAGQ